MSTPGFSGAAALYRSAGSYGPGAAPVTRSGAAVVPAGIIDWIACGAAVAGGAAACAGTAGLGCWAGGVAASAACASAADKAVKAE